MVSYFKHDVNVFQSKMEIKILLAEMGANGYGIYMLLLETLLQNDNTIKENYAMLSKVCKATEQDIHDVINNYDLFRVENNVIHSIFIESQLNKIRYISNIRRGASMNRIEAKNQWSKNDEF